MRIQVRASAMVLAGLLAGSGYGVSLTLQGQQSQQDNSGQQPSQDKDKDKQKKKKDQQGGNTGANNTGTNPSGGAPLPANPPAGNPPAGGDKPTPLFGGSIGLKSSRQTKDSATLGFNGVDPNGQVQKSFLTAAVTPVDAMKAQQVAQLKSDAAELSQFLQDGGLNPDAAPQKP